MASLDEEQPDTQYCVIEASVVTGFEESARAEAREKFGTDVKAARGKISWKVPINRVKEVIKLGAIDNARVVVYTVPHFKFTDQYDSLARLQQLVPEMDWEMGLQVWRQFSEFPHPVASAPEVIPSLEDLIDVVISRQPPAKDKSEKKSRKGGRGKKKEKKWGKGKDKDGGKKVEGGDEKEEVSAQEGTGKGGGGDDAKDKDSLSAVENVVNDIVESAVNEKLDVHNSCTEGNTEGNTTSDSGDGAKGDASCDIAEGNKENAGESAGADKSFSIPSPKTVVIKKADPSRVEPEIEIKVLDPGLSVNAFPTDVDDQDQRDVEPMDIDQSMNRSVLNTSQASSDQDKESKKVTDDEKKGVSLSITTDAKSDEHVLEKDKDSPIAAACSAAVDAACEFASSVIEKLSSPTHSPHRDNNLTPLSTSPFQNRCSTPPSTPVRNVDCLVFSPHSKTGGSDELQGTETESKTADQSAFTGESSVDPVAEAGSNESKVLPVSLSLTSLPQPSAVLSNTETESGSGEASSDASKQQESQETSSSSPVKKERDPTKPSFRVTCNRVGEGHPFDSSSAAASLGSSVITYFSWPVDLKNFDMEILLNIDNEEVTVSLALTKTSLHNRNLVAFGPTTLRATICYNMLRLCRIKNGDFICDPMCGTSAIPIESAVNWVNCYHFGGDFHEKAIERTITNISAIQEKLQAEDKGTLKIDAVQWNIQHFPLRDKCVDVFVSDLPFGHRMGSRTVNRTLYPCLLSEMARTARSGARACLLTEDKTSLIKAIQATGRYWQRRLILSINIGGLSGFVFLLTRTAAAMAPAASAWRPGTEDGSAIAEQNDLPAQDAHDQVNGASTQGEVVDVAATEGEKGSGASAEAETSM